MSQSTICRLCLQACQDFESLYNDNDRANELYELTLEYFHPKIVDMEAAKHLTAVCVECARHIYDFHQFQTSITAAQLNLFKEMDHRKVAIKTEKLEEDFPCSELLSSDNVSAENAFTIIKMEEDESISEDYNQPKALKVSVESSSADEFATDEFNVSQGPRKMIKLEQCPKNSPHTPMVEVAHAASTDFSVKTELEIIDVHQNSEHSSDDDADIPATDGGAAAKKTSKHICTICGNSFTRKANLVNHMRRQHGNKGEHDTRQRFQCDLCSNFFISRSNLKGHMKQQHGLNPGRSTNFDIDFDIDFDEATKKFSCQICGKCYTLRLHLVHHMERVHPEMRKTANNSDNVTSEPAFACEVFKCKLCDYACEFKGSLRRHMKQRHGIAAPKFEFDYEESTQMFKCKVCQAAFRYENSLRKHMEQTHWEQDDVSQKFEFDYDDKTKVFRCKLCGSSQENTQSLVTHMAGQHWITPIAKYGCQICDSTFATKLALAQHYNATHCPPGLYPCNECGNTFNKFKLLQQHRRQIHSSYPKPHKCENCGKTFRTPSELKRHLLSHTVNKMYSCAFCPIKFKYSTNLVQHTKRVHPHETDNRGGAEDVVSADAMGEQH